MKLHSFLFCILISTFAHARMEVLFHPHDPTLERIAEWISQAQSTVDIAMYNMETSTKSPVIQALKSSETQKRIHEGELKIRLIFEGYATAEENQKKMAELESLGIDVRYLGKAVKIHHKFAVLDAGLHSHKVITGSANWSLSSARNYNENILFITDEEEVTGRFHQEFFRIWKKSKSFGFETEIPEHEAIAYRNQRDVEIFFNSPESLDFDVQEETNLTAQVVRHIQNAKATLKIATTRVRLQPVLEALSDAAESGVKIKLLISQDDFRDLYRRKAYLLSNPNLQLRVKIYNLKISEYMTYQMHNKFMIVDDETVLTGSFNWSNSSEKNHIENLVEISGVKAQEILPTYTQEFDFLWGMGRSEFGTLKHDLLDPVHAKCAISPMALGVSEIWQLLKLAPQCRH